MLLKQIGVENVKILFSNVKRMHYLEHWLLLRVLWKCDWRCNILLSNSEAYLEPGLTSTVELFWEYRAVNKQFLRKTTSWMLDWVLNTPLKLSKFLGFLRISQATVGERYSWHCQEVLNRESLLSMKILVTL